MKKYIFHKLYYDLKHVEIIPFEDAIWFIDREKKYWFLEYRKSRVLFWRLSFFDDFFRFFSMEHPEYEPFIVEWVEEVLDYKVKKSKAALMNNMCSVEEVLDCKVEISSFGFIDKHQEVEEVLDYKVEASHRLRGGFLSSVEEVLNYKVEKSFYSPFNDNSLPVDKVLNSKSLT